MDPWEKWKLDRVRELGVQLKVRDTEQSVVAKVFASDTALLAKSEWMLQRIVDEFDRVCRRRKLSECWQEQGNDIWEGKRT